MDRLQGAWLVTLGLSWAPAAHTELSCGAGPGERDSEQDPGGLFAGSSSLPSPAPCSGDLAPSGSSPYPHPGCCVGDSEDSTGPACCKPTLSKSFLGCAECCRDPHTNWLLPLGTGVPHEPPICLSVVLGPLGFVLSWPLGRAHLRLHHHPQGTAVARKNSRCPAWAKMALLRGRERPKAPSRMSRVWATQEALLWGARIQRSEGPSPGGLGLPHS